MRNKATWTMGKNINLEFGIFDSRNKFARVCFAYITFMLE
jgi:hypothetical protein